MTIHLFGQSAARGIAVGRAHVINTDQTIVPEYTIAPQDLDAELERLRNGLDKIRAHLHELALQLDGHPEFKAFTDLGLTLLADPMWTDDIAQCIRDQRINAELALQRQLDSVKVQFRQMEDQYLSERFVDINHIISRLINELSGGTSLTNIPEHNAVLVANDIPVTDMLAYRNSNICALITDAGGATSHTAILARSMGIPAVVATQFASRWIQSGDTLAVHGDLGTIVVAPEPIEIRAFVAQQHANDHPLDQHLPTQTSEGTRVHLYANIELPQDATTALKYGAEGIGLFRSEFIILQRHTVPSEELQYQAYRQVVEIVQPRPVTIRTFDLGGDKNTVGQSEHNHSALGVRAIRLSLQQPEFFLTQLRAILRAAAPYPNVRILLPMITSADDLIQARALLETAKKQVNLSHLNIPLGAMIETPAAALALHTLNKHADFFSIGSNDLTQYLLATDRSDPNVAPWYNPSHSAVVQLIGQSVKQADRWRKPISLCGELAADPAAISWLIGLGLRHFSLASSQIATIKQAIHQCHVATGLKLAKQLRQGKKTSTL